MQSLEAETIGGGKKNRLRHRLKVLTHPALLLVDEIGYLPISRSGATLLFQLVNGRYEVASPVLTSMAAVLINRILPHCHIVNIQGNRYRTRKHSDLWNALASREPQDPPIRSDDGLRLVPSAECNTLGRRFCHIFSRH